MQRSAVIDSAQDCVIYSDPPFCFKEKSADTMNKVNYLQQRQTDSLPFDENPDIKRLSVYQPLDAFRNQTGKNNHWFAVFLEEDTANS